MKPANFLQ